MRKQAKNVTHAMHGEYTTENDGWRRKNHPPDLREFLRPMHRRQVWKDMQQSDSTGNLQVHSKWSSLSLYIRGQMTLVLGVVLDDAAVSWMFHSM